MFGSGRHTGRFARAIAALAFLTPNIAAGQAQDFARNGVPQRGAASFGGPVAMVGVRIPFGGKAVASSQPVVGLSIGSSWRAGPGSTVVPAYRFVPTIEAGFSLRGDPILRLSSFEVRLDQLHAAPGEAEPQTFCGRNLAICIAGGVAIIAAVLVVALADSDDCAPSDNYPPGEDPCRCYQANGC
jgi:hypothetical protein